MGEVRPRRFSCHMLLNVIRLQRSTLMDVLQCAFAMESRVQYAHSGALKGYRTVGHPHSPILYRLALFLSRLAVGPELYTSGLNAGNSAA